MAVRANHRTWIQHAVAAYLDIISQHRAYFFPACGDTLLPCADHHQGFIAFDIGGNGTGPHVRVTAQNRVPNVIVVGHLDPIKQDHIL